MITPESLTSAEIIGEAMRHARERKAPPAIGVLEVGESRWTIYRVEIGDRSGHFAARIEAGVLRVSATCGARFDMNALGRQIEASMRLAVSLPLGRVAEPAGTDAAEGPCMVCGEPALPDPCDCGARLCSACYVFRGPADLGVSHSSLVHHVPGVLAHVTPKGDA